MVKHAWTRSMFKNITKKVLPCLRWFRIIASLLSNHEKSDLTQHSKHEGQRIMLQFFNSSSKQYGGESLLKVLFALLVNTRRYTHLTWRWSRNIFVSISMSQKRKKCLARRMLPEFIWQQNTFDMQSHSNVMCCQKKRYGGVYYCVYSIVFWMPIQQNSLLQRNFKIAVNVIRYWCN